MTHLYVNGRILPQEEAVISANDRAVVFGDGAYETMRSYSGVFFRFPEHLKRLRNTLEGMRLALPVTDEEITRGANELIRINGVPEARLRLTVTGGLHEGSIRLRRPHPPNLIMVATPLPPPPPQTFRDGVEVVISPWRVHTRSPLPQIKTITRLMHLMAKEDALERGAWDALFCDETGAILEGTATNVFFVVDGALRTASLESPLLAGVTRDLVLEIAGEAGVPVREGRLGLEEVDRSEEAFLTSTTIELLPIQSVDGRTVGDGRPGPICRELHRRYRATVMRETGVTLDPLPTP